VPGRIVLYGATGYIGGLIARAMVAGGARPVLAGRDQGRLDALAERLSRNSDGVKLETAVAGSEGPGPLRELIGAGILGAWAYPVTRPGLLMARATLPGLLSVLRPVVVPTRSCRLHRLTPHCERAPARMNPACRDVPRGGSAKNPQQPVRSGR